MKSASAPAGANSIWALSVEHAARNPSALGLYKKPHRLSGGKEDPRMIRALRARQNFNEQAAKLTT
jgi:hypothetical protein